MHDSESSRVAQAEYAAQGVHMLLGWQAYECCALHTEAPDAQTYKSEGACLASAYAQHGTSIHAVWCVPGW